jgi:hypothetical protein
MKASLKRPSKYKFEVTIGFNNPEFYSDEYGPISKII